MGIPAEESRPVVASQTGRFAIFSAAPAVAVGVWRVIQSHPGAYFRAGRPQAQQAGGEEILRATDCGAESGELDPSKANVDRLATFAAELKVVVIPGSTHFEHDITTAELRRPELEARLVGPLTRLPIERIILVDSHGVGLRKGSPPHWRFDMHCHLNAPLVVLAYGDNHNAAVTIPAGEIIDVIGTVENDDRFAVVQFAGEQFHAFETDLRQSAILLKSEQEAGGGAALVRAA